MSSNQNAFEAKAAAAGDAMNDLRLAAARKRLVESTDEADAIEGLREIVANLLGCEEIGLFKLEGKKKFTVCWSFGADLENYDLLKALGDAGRERMMRGECHMEMKTPERAGGRAIAQAFVPLREANETLGVLAILRLLPQKTAFDAHDMELFKLLSAEAAGPLFGASDERGKQKKDRR